MDKKVGIIGAMDVELAALKAKLGGKTELKSGMWAFTEGILNGVDVVLVKSGVGKVNAALCTQRLIFETGVTHIINTGVGGALQKDLNVFDFVVSESAVYHDMDATGFGYKPTVIPQMSTSEFKADADMIKATKDAFAAGKEFADHKLVSGRIATGDQFIRSADVKKHIQSICSPVCVEMEGAGVAHACFLNDTPFVIIRCMSDVADESVKTTYSYNEETAAHLSADLVCAMVGRF